MYLVSHKFNLFLAKRKYNHHCANFITQFGFFVSVMNPLETVKYSACHMMIEAISWADLYTTCEGRSPTGILARI